MNRLEDLQPNTAVRGILPDSLVTVVSAQWFGTEALELTYDTKISVMGKTVVDEQDKCTGIYRKEGTQWLILHEHCSEQTDKHAHDDLTAVGPHTEKSLRLNSL